MALLILERLDRRVDQQWINKAPMAGQKDPTGMVSSYFERLTPVGRTPAGSSYPKLKFWTDMVRQIFLCSFLSEFFSLMKIHLSHAAALRFT